MSLLVDEELVIKFCEEVVPELEKDEVLTVMLVARKKYGHVSTSQEMLNFMILKRSDPDYILRKLRKFTRVENVYRDRNTNEIVPPQCMVVYIDLTPRSTIKAFKTLISEGLDRLYGLLNGDEGSMKFFKNLNRSIMSTIARSRSRQLYLIVDIDNKDVRLLGYVFEKLQDYIVWITETRGGFHVIVNKTKESGKIAYQLASGINFGEGCSVEVQSKQAMTPIPGTLQGGFLVRGAPL